MAQVKLQRQNETQIFLCKANGVGLENVRSLSLLADRLRSEACALFPLNQQSQSYSIFQINKTEKLRCDLDSLFLLSIHTKTQTGNLS
jgi:hypothetical protein